MKLSNLIPFSLSLLAAASASAQFWSVGVPPGSFANSMVTGLSSDGSVAAGRAMGDAVGGAFVWTPQSGRYSIGQEAGVPNGTWAHGISGDGRVLIGSGIAPGELEEASRWSGPGTYQGLGNMGTFMASRAVATNRDGSTIVGHLLDERGGPGFSFIWTESAGMRYLGTPDEAFNAVVNCVSDDGRVVAGGTVGSTRAFVWNEQSGYRYLSDLPGGNNSSEILGMNGSGSIFVGRGSTNLGIVGALWVDDIAIDLGKLPRYSGFLATCVNELGTIVAGNSGSNFPDAPDVATVWTTGRGLETLSDYLVSQGVVLPMNTRLATCTSMSDDGMTFGGLAVSTLNNSTYGYVVTVPTPSSLAPAICGVLSLAARRRRSIHL